jgi:hypothetical protein
VQCTVLTPPPSCPGLLSLIASPANGSHVIIVEQHRDGAEPLVLTRIEEAIPDAPRRAGRHHGHGDAPSPNHVRQQRMRLAIRLAEYFRTNDPARLGEVDALLHKYQGHERQLLRDIRAQYGVPLSGPSEKNYVRRNGLGRVLVMPQSDTLEQRVKARTRDASTAKSAPRKAWGMALRAFARLLPLSHPHRFFLFLSLLFSSLLFSSLSHTHPQTVLERGE